MTFTEIYNTVWFCTWGNTNPPQGAQDHIMRIFRNVHRTVQRDFNFWFMLFDYSFDTVIGQSMYEMPDRFKEVEFMNIVTPSGARTEPLKELDLSSEEELALEMSQETAEYPEYYMCNGTEVILYPTPSAIKSVRMRLWKYIETPTGTFADLTAANYNDDVTTYLGEALVNRIVSDIMLVMNEWQGAQMWKEKYFEELDTAQREDMRRRQNTTGRYHAI